MAWRADIQRSVVRRSGLAAPLVGGGLPGRSRCPTRARRSGTSRTRPGSSRRSCSAPHRRLSAVRSDVRVPVQFVLRGRRRRGIRARRARAADAADARRGARATARTSTSACSARSSAASTATRSRARIVLGLHHEQQHQELILTDIKHALRRSTRCGRRIADAPTAAPSAQRGARRSRWIARPAASGEIGVATPGPAASRSRSTTRRRGTVFCARSRSRRGW